ncbi:unnamed protein product [Ectocarpus sp. CCAP 1310/34]|nr:unnamed protein product [Ectocarpus sp. CCAP 1310/34]
MSNSSESEAEGGSSSSSSVVDLTNLSTDKSTLLSGLDGADDEGGREESGSDIMSSTSDFSLAPGIIPRTPPARRRQSRRSSPRFADRRGTGAEESSSGGRASSAGSTPSPTGGGSSSERPRSSSRTPKRPRYPEAEGYSKKYVESVAGRRDGLASGASHGGGSKGSPLELSSQDSGASGEVDTEPSDSGGGGRGGEKGGKKGRPGEQREATGSGREKSPRWWTQPGEKEYFYRLIPKHCASKHTSTDDKNREWWSVAEGLMEATSITIVVRLKTREDKSSKLVRKAVKLNMRPKMEDDVQGKLKTIWLADRSRWDKKHQDKKKLTGEGSDGEDESSEAQALEEAVHAWEAGLEEKKSKEGKKTAHAAKAGDIRDTASEDHHARSKQSTTGARSSRGRGRGQDRGGGVSGVEKKQRRRRKSSESGDDDDLFDDGHGPTGSSTSRTRMEREVERASSEDGDDDDDEQDAEDLARGAMGRSTRSGIGGGRRRRGVQTLSAWMGNDPMTAKIYTYLDKITENRGESAVTRGETDSRAMSHLGPRY